MVKDELIIRYLHADERTAEFGNASTAITPADYKFRYAGAIHLHDYPAYVFRIIPHKKREGLIKACCGLTADTGLPVRRSGYLVKNPSIFLKRVNVTRENVLRGGIVEAWITLVFIDTRLVGSARLVVVERPTEKLQELNHQFHNLDLGASSLYDRHLIFEAIRLRNEI